MASHNRERGSLRVFKGGKQSPEGEGESGGYQGVAGGSPDPDAKGGPGAGRRYDSREFVTPASDEKGHGQPASVRFPPSIGREISRILNSHKFPYETTGDLIRHALIRHIRWLHSLEPELGEGGGLARIEAALEIFKSEQECLQFKDHVTRSDEVIQAMLDADAKPRAVYLLHSLLAQVDTMGGEYWVEKYKAYVLGRWGYLLQGASLKPSDADTTSTDEVEGDT